MTYFRLQICCLTALLYIGFVYIRDCKKYHCKARQRNNYLANLLGLGIAEVALDGAVSYSVNHLDTVPRWLDLGLELFWLMTIDAVIFTLLLYLIHITGLSPRTGKGRFLIFLPYFCSTAVMIATVGSLKYVQGKYTNYPIGLPVYCCYIMAAVYVMLAVIIFAKRWNYIHSSKLNGLITFMTVYTVIMAVQMFFPETFVSGFAVTVIILGVYLNFEDPAIIELDRFSSESVMCFATLIENRYSGTDGHIKRTAAYVRLIAEELRRKGHYTDILTKDYIENLINSVPMHDIGKICVPDSIIRKPDKLTAEEFEIMKKHPVDGGRIIRESFSDLGSSEYSRIALEVAGCHHEKWNGKGYPEGLEGKEIPLSARIMAVADVFDALSEKRCYRDALPLEECFKVIAEGSGRDFDPIIAETFLEVRERVEMIHNAIMDPDSKEKVCTQ